MFAQTHHFSKPEQFAMRAVLDLIADKKIHITNFFFFSSIESTPIKRITTPRDRTSGSSLRSDVYAQTRIMFYCRGEPIAVAHVEGSIAETSDGDLVHLWSIARLSGRREYWRNDPEESELWDTHECHGYTSIRSGSDEEEKEFEDMLRRTVF